MKYDTDKMKVLVIGGGGREHALVWKIAQSSRVAEILCLPGNGGTAALARRPEADPADVASVARMAKREGVGLVIVGPEQPLVEGLADRLRDEGIAVFGPSASAARLEGSKVFTKDLLKEYKIPSAEYESFEDPEEALAFARSAPWPVVVKADGLAAGKGVVVCDDAAQAVRAVERIMIDRVHGAAGARVVIEERLEGEEASFIAITDGRTVLPLAASQDHKAAYDGDKGPNTGGMGAYSPAPVVTKAVFDHIQQDIMIPTVRALEAEGSLFRGVLYGGLMIKDGRAKVLEFNVRFGDPECQPLLARLKTDLVEVILAAVAAEEGRLEGFTLEWDPRPAVCVVMAAEGYPGSYEKGKAISGIEEAEALGAVVFHAGTRIESAKVLTDGGRVLGVTALGEDIAQAIEKAYAAVEKISWDGLHYRTDIGRKALARLG